MTRRAYANISDAEMRRLRFLIAGWACVNFGRKGLGTAYAQSAIEWLEHGMKMNNPANRENAVVHAWGYFRAACMHLPRTES